ncbi:MAG: LptA/OstA family protein [Beijerinckiaceae bacterium]
MIRMILTMFLLVTACVAVTPALAQGAQGRANPFGGFGGNSKDPIRIDAEKLEVFDGDKEQRAVYSGDVIAVRGATTTRSSRMIIYIDNNKNKQGGAGAVRSQGQTPSQDGALKRIEFKGPVSVVNGTQTATANEMIYDAVAKVVTLKGNAVVADGPNIQRGELMTYSTEAGTAVITNPGGRVQGIFTPGSDPQSQTPGQPQGQQRRPAANAPR